MIVRYSNGYRMPSNAVEALQYLGKVGVLSSKDWHQFFGDDKHIRWQKRQLSYLQKLGYIKRHNAESMKGKWVLADLGKELLYKHQWTLVHPVPAHHIDHDEVVARSLLTLEREKYILSWKVERELKLLNQKEFMVSNKDGDCKYPDAIFKMKVAGELKTIAIEYERTGKTQSRYRSILWSYAGLSHISLVLFICEDQQIRRRIENAYAYSKQPELIDRLAFVQAIDWKNGPLNAPIEMDRGEIQFIKVCQKFEKLKAS